MNESKLILPYMFDWQKCDNLSLSNNDSTL